MIIDRPFVNHIFCNLHGYYNTDFHKVVPTHVTDTNYFLQVDLEELSQRKLILNAVFHDWVNLQQVGRLRHWRQEDSLLSLIKDNWDNIDVAQVHRDYAALATHQQHKIGRKVRFANTTNNMTANNTSIVRTPDMYSKPDNGKDNQENYKSDNNQHHESDSNSDNSTNANDDDTGTDDDNTTNNNIDTVACKDAYEHGYNTGFDTGTAYATGYADGHVDSQDAMVVSDDNYDDTCNSDDDHYGTYKW